jgi:hypothetical protein
MLALSVVIQESLYSMGRKLKSAFWHTTLQRPHLVRERNVLGFLRELDDGEHSSAQALSPRSIYSFRHGADRRRHTALRPPLPQTRLCSRGLLLCSGSTKKLLAR